MLHKVYAVSTPSHICSIICIVQSLPTCPAQTMLFLYGDQSFGGTCMHKCTRKCTLPVHPTKTKTTNTRVAKNQATPRKVQVQNKQANKQSNTQHQTKSKSQTSKPTSNTKPRSNAKQHKAKSKPTSNTKQAQKQHQASPTKVDSRKEL